MSDFNRWDAFGYKELFALYHALRLSNGDSKERDMLVQELSNELRGRDFGAGRKAATR